MPHCWGERTGEFLEFLMLFPPFPAVAPHLMRGMAFWHKQFAALNEESQARGDGRF
jgi:hypothetical protein